MKLKNRVSLITGASSGIGEGIAKKFLEEGAFVVGCGIENKSSIIHPNYLYMQGDITNLSSIEEIVKLTKEKFGKLDSVVNSAGATFIGNLEETSTESFKKQFDINVIGTFNVCKAAIAELKENKGTIVNIASDLGIKPIPDRIAYCASKAAVIMLTKSIAIEYAPLVRANCILPGLVETPMIKDRFDNSENPQKLREEMANLYVLKRMGTLDDMSNAAVFLTSEDSSFITGSELAVCGGSQI
ncbi:MAG: SDR family NAD(P)-dependent oxidoreductase [Cetobacterium sp.]|uniref:SDR family NAD(P)-dependent oxidoreductase n=1 Tax=Cetobacterium sp. TaxID=2071632 RepID=UPI003EE73907